MEVAILFSCNAWHEHSSKKTIGVFNNKRALQKYLNGMKNAKMINAESLCELNKNQQTQGLDTNYLIETSELNPMPNFYIPSNKQ